MTACPACRARFREGSLRCPACGFALSGALRAAARAGALDGIGAVCERCDTLNAMDAPRCAGCGAPLEGDSPLGVSRACPSCGVALPVGAKFCVACGARNV